MRANGTMLGICTAILIVASLYLARPVVAPVAMALFIIALVWPLQAALETRIPQLLAMIGTLAAIIVVIAILGALIVWGFGQAGRWLVVNAARFQSLYNETASSLESRGLYSAGLAAQSFNVSWLIRQFQGVATRLHGMIGFAVVSLVFVMLGLLEVGTIRRKLEGSDRAACRRAVPLALEIGAKLRKYMAVRTLMSALTGAAIWAFTAAMGVELAPAWGAIAFALNYIPFVGPLVATVLPTLFALVQSGSWELPLAVFAGMNLIQFFGGSYIEPRLAGAALAMSPFVVLLAVFFWGFLWGVTGAFIGVPVTIVALTICEHTPGARWLALLLSGRPTTMATREPGA